MDSYRYLQEAAKVADSLETREEIMRVIDELEFVYEALDPEHQELASDLISRLMQRLQNLPE